MLCGYPKKKKKGRNEKRKVVSARFPRDACEVLSECFSCASCHQREVEEKNADQGMKTKLEELVKLGIERRKQLAAPINTSSDNCIWKTSTCTHMNGNLGSEQVRQVKWGGGGGGFE